MPAGTGSGCAGRRMIRHRVIVVHIHTGHDIQLLSKACVLFEIVYILTVQKRIVNHWKTDKMNINNRKNRHKMLNNDKKLLFGEKTDVLSGGALYEKLSR